MPERARNSVRRAIILLERSLLFLWLVIVLPVIASDVQRLPDDVSFASSPAWAPIDLTLDTLASVEALATRTGEALPAVIPAPSATASPASGVSAGQSSVAPQAIPSTADAQGNAGAGTAEPGGEPVQVPEPAGTEAIEPEPTATEQPAPAPPPRYVRGGIDFGSDRWITMSYPASLDGEETIQFEDLYVLQADATGENYRRFISEYDRQLYAYPEIVLESFVLSVHDGTLGSSNRPLEAEPLRRLIEGSLYSPIAISAINARMAALEGREFEFVQDDTIARFRISQVRRMSARDVAEYLYRPMELSLFMDPIPSPETSFLLLFCSGRQPFEPQVTFPGRYVMVLEHDPEASAAATARAQDE